MQIQSNGKVRRTSHEWDEIFAEFEASGLSVAAFCRSKKLPKSTFSKRRIARERRPATRRTKPARFLELTAAPPASSPAPTAVVGLHAFELLRTIPLSE